MEECVAAITNASLMRIRLENTTSGKEINSNSSNIDLSDRELDCRESNSGVSFHNRVLSSLVPKGEDDGSFATLHHTNAKERLLQGDAALDRMELEGGRETSGPF